MQLLILLALLLFGGKGNARNLLSEVKPVLESLGGDDMRQALENAEQISEVLSAVQGMASADTGITGSPHSQNVENSFPLAPISKIADKDITYSLSRYISCN